MKYVNAWHFHRAKPRIIASVPINQDATDTVTHLFNLFHHLEDPPDDKLIIETTSRPADPNTPPSI